MLIFFHGIIVIFCNWDSFCLEVNVMRLAMLHVFFFGSRVQYLKLNIKLGTAFLYL